MSKDDFKLFVRNNPKLINYVNSGEMTWQKFYEMYDLYGESSNVWDNYLGNSKLSNSILSHSGVSDFLKLIKMIDLDSIQNGVNNLQRVLSVLSELSNNDKSENVSSDYKPRPIYKHFED